MIKKISLLILIFLPSLVFGQNRIEIDASKVKIKAFDKISDNNLIKKDSNKIRFGYSKNQQRFVLQFDEELLTNKYYRIDIKGLEVLGNSSPVFFAQFYNGKNRIENIIFNIHQEYYVIKTPEVFDNFKLVIQYTDGQVEFSSISYTEYNIKKEQKQSPNKSFISMILPVIDASDVDSINFSERVINDSVFKNKYYDFGNYYEHNLWQGNEHSRTEQRWVHGFFWLLNLLDTYKQTDDLNYLKKSSEIIKIWDSYTKTEVSQNNKMVWHDETTARRLFALLYAHTYLTALEDTALNELLKKHLTEHAEKLAKENFYTRNNNHGMFQSLSLYAYSMYNSWDSLSHVYHDLALARVTDYLLFSFTNEGISKENTPSYHYLISKQLGDFIKVFNKLESAEIIQKLETTFENSKYYSLNLIKPNGFTPSLGDNITFNPDSSFNNFLKDIDNDKYRESTNICFKESGYAIMRSNWDDPQSFYLFFSAAYHHWSHKHNDDLSFMMTYNGNDILIDCSFFGYEYNQEIVKFGYSSFAHNSLVVDNTSLGILSKQDKKYSEVGINHWHDTEDEVYVKGYNRRWDNTEHYRAIKWKNQDIVIIDSIVAKDNKYHNYKLLYHFDKNIVPRIKKDKVILELNNKIIATIKFSTEEKLNLHTFKGNEYPDTNFKGFHCEKMGDYTPIDHYVLIIEFINKNGLIETCFKLN